MPRALASTDKDALIRAEQDVAAAFDGLHLDLRSLFAVSNIFRVATAVRNHMERTVLAEFDLGWTAFTTIFVLRVWGEQESHALAAQVGITGGTLTGVVRTLQERGLVTRKQHPSDKRRVLVSLSAKGRRLVDKVMPAFNVHEALVTRELSATQRDNLAAALRTVLLTVEVIDS